MAAIPVGLIRVLTTTDQELLHLHGKLIMQWFPGLDVRSECIPDQPEGVHDDETEALAEPKVLDLMAKMEAEGAKAIIVSCAGDPGVAAAPGRVSVPVIGAGRAVAHMACLLGLPTGVLGITTTPPAAVCAALGKLYVGNLVPRGVGSTLDLMKPAGMEAVLDAGKTLVDQGAGCLLLACTGLATIGAAAVLRERLGVPVLDAVRAEAAATWMIAG